MRQLEAAFRQLAERAEPLPTEVLIARIETELGWAGAASAVAATEEPTMVTSQQPDIEIPTTTPPRQTSRRGPLLAAGVAAIVVLIGVGVTWALGSFDTEADLADGVPPQIATLEAAIDAYNAYDFDAHLGYWAEGGIDRGAVVGGPGWREAVAVEEAIGVQIALGECEVTDTAVTCLETYQELLSAPAGLVGTYEAEYTFNDEGLIESRFFDIQLDEFEAFEDALGRWMETAHPEMFETYYVPDFYTPKYENMFTPEGVAELSPIIAEFIAQSDTYPLNP